MSVVCWFTLRRSPTPAPTGDWINDGGTTILYEVVIFSVCGGLAALVLIHYIALYVQLVQCVQHALSHALHGQHSFMGKPDMPCT